MEKQVFSWCDRKQCVHLMHYNVCSRFSHDAPIKVLICCIITWNSRFFPWHVKNSYIWCINTWKSRFSHEATVNNVYIWCIIMFHSRFSHDAPKTLIFDALLPGKAGFLMTCQKLLYLMHYLYLMHEYVEKQVFSWRHRKQSVHLMHYYV